jgi:D-arabinose 1-dehydrogenase-like Zn-dependent alcohol dehydrogenase
LERVHLDEVRPGEILIKVKRANICGSDLHAWHGDFNTRGLGGKLPTVLGHEMVGTVEELGEGITTDASGKPLAKGARVVFPYFTACGCCQSCLAGRRVGCPKMTMAMLGSAAERPYFVGGYGDFYLLPVGSVVYTVPESVSDDLAAGANCALSQVMHGLERVDQVFGDDVVVQGAGGLGLYAVAVAKARGARQVIAVDGVRDRLELATAFGADHVIDLTGFADIELHQAGSNRALQRGSRRLHRWPRFLWRSDAGCRPNGSKFKRWCPSQLPRPVRRSRGQWPRVIDRTRRS